MKEKLDIMFGLLAWLIALSIIPIGVFFSFEKQMVIGPTLVPLLWLCCVRLVFKYRKRLAGKLWWVWLSGPVAFSYFGLYVFLMINIFTYAP